MHPVWYVPIGFLVGTYGTIIGAGGGFILVPLLVFLFPEDGPSMVTAASLAIIFVNAASGTIAYAVQKRIDYRTGAFFAAATIPGALLGSYLTRFIPKRVFGLVFGCLLVAVAATLAITRGRRRPAAAAAPGPALERAPEMTTRQLALGMGLSLFIGCFSSLVGIGGGLIHVPVLTYAFGFPLHAATATSHFVLVFTALAGVVEHLLERTWPTHLARDALLAAGVVGGAQLGAYLSRKVAASWIVAGLAAALAVVGVRLVLTAL
jgi:uncharacterized membrane protein YfcA